MTTEAETLEAPVAGPGVASRDHNLPSGEELLLMVAREPTLPLTDKDMRARFIAALEADVADAGDDVSTEAARSKIADAGRRVSRYKTGIDKARLELTADMRAKVTSINDEGKAVDTTLQALQDKVSAPLVKWKAAEAQRQEAVKRVFDRIAYVAMCSRETQSSVIGECITELETMTFDRAIFTEGTMAVEEARDNALRDLRVTKVASEQREAEARELAELRAEREARTAEDAKRIADELAAKEAAEAERQRAAKVEQDAADAAAREKAESDRRIREAQESAAAAAQAEIDAANERAAKIERDAQAELDRQAQVRRDEEAARQRQVDADAARARDQAHRAEVHAKAEEAIVALGVSAAKAKQVVMAIAAGNVPGVSVEY